MTLLTKNDLQKTYSWTALKHDDPKVSGEPDSTLLNRGEGYEILYFINKLAEKWGFTNKVDGLKIERMVHLTPARLHSQENIKAWIQANWSSN